MDSHVFTMVTVELMSAPCIYRWKVHMLALVPAAPSGHDGN